MGDEMVRVARVQLALHEQELADARAAMNKSPSTTLEKAAQAANPFTGSTFARDMAVLNDQPAAKRLAQAEANVNESRLWLASLEAKQAAFWTRLFAAIGALGTVVTVLKMLLGK